MSAYYALPGDVLPTGTGQPAPAPVLVAFADQAPQSRVTVLVRIFMVLPQFIVLGLLGIAAYVITIIGWFAALFTGRLPVFAADFLTGYLRWQTRVFAYTFLLTGQYPPFSLDDADYPVRIAVRPGPLNRLAVLFRIVLLIPCWIVQTIVSYGAFTILALVSWLIAVITGRLPDTVYQALAAAMRYQVRTLGYALMLTSAYPAGLFGDPQGDAGDAGLPWRLVLSGGARKLMVAFIVLGVLLAGGSSAVGAALGSTVSAADAAYQVQADAKPAADAIDNFSANVKACNGQLSCVTRLDRQVAATLSTFARQLRSIAMPSAKASSQDAALAASVSRAASIFARLGAATSPSQYIAIAKSAGLQQPVDQINQDYANLSNDLSS